MKSGEIYVDVSNEEAESTVEKLKHETKVKLDELNQQQNQIMKELEELKTILYSKFGKSINLDISDAEETA